VLAIKEYRLGHLQKVADIYRLIVTAMPDYAQAYNNLGSILQQMQLYDEALVSYHQAISLRPDMAETYVSQGTVLDHLTRYDEALISYNQAIALRPDYAPSYYYRGNSLVSKGDMVAAEQMFRKAIALKPNDVLPLYSLVHIAKYQDEDIIHINKLLDQPEISPQDKAYLYFALGKIHDDCGRYDQAFEAYRQANEICNRDVSYSAKGVMAMTSAIIGVFNKEFLAQPYGSDSRSPIFIVGMPRSGTTLMASILSNHSQIAMAGELPTILEDALHLAEWTNSTMPYPFAAKHVTPELASTLVDDYEKRLRRDCEDSVPYVIDKHPLNFRHLGFISILFPSARIIHCMRHPLDTILSNYFQRFPQSYEYAFDLENISHFYGEYDRLMQHWRQVLPGNMIEVRYEEMVMDTEAAARKTLDFLGLAWEDGCLAPHKNKYAVETASKWQVRQPIYSQSMERWRHYEKYLSR